MDTDGFILRPSRTLPHLDEKCGRHFLFHDFTQYGETQANTGTPNTPEQAETYNTLVGLATRVLDPVIDYFGGIVLTYGFCSRALAKHIPGRTTPALDQHASHELNVRGKLICPRRGAAVDFIVADESMLEVAQWIVQNTPFDRLYFYGDNRPIHVSSGPENKSAIVVMKTAKNGRSIPQVMRVDAFAALLQDPAIS